MFSEGGTPLHWAAGEGKINAVEALIELGAEVLLHAENDISVEKILRPLKP